MYSSLRILTRVAACILVISGCGLRGPLVLPPGPAPVPLLGKGAELKAPNSAEQPIKTPHSGQKQ